MSSSIEPVAIFVHGSFGWGEDTFPEQQALSDCLDVRLVDRVGFGGDLPDGPTGWTVDGPALVTLLETTGPAHLIGQSYGAVVVLLVASKRPDLVRSLVAIEPPLFHLAVGHERAAEMADAQRALHTRAGRLSEREFVIAWTTDVMGRPAERASAWLSAFGDRDWDAVRATQREALPEDAPIGWADLAAAHFPRLVITGGWASEPDLGAAFAAVGREVTDRIGAEARVFEGSAHNPQIEQPAEFNALIRQLAGCG